MTARTGDSAYGFGKSPVFGRERQNMERVDFVERNPRRWGAALLFILGAMCLMPGDGAAQSMVGHCTPGELSCQVNEEQQCDCHDRIVEDDGGRRIVIVCSWQPTGNSCGDRRPPPVVDCTPSREGVVVEFAGGNIKTCRCIGDDCGWQ